MQQTPKSIAAVDCTYAYTQKSSNFCISRKSFSQHKHRNLIKRKAYLNNCLRRALRNSCPSLRCWLINENIQQGRLRREKGIRVQPAPLTAPLLNPEENRKDKTECEEESRISESTNKKLKNKAK